ncbi:tenascin isoform 2 [Chrysochromulina tobinii]|uniref:Tenascin isoform 2 n=1 Tax=Chrysochromulina tobinii TaxID=1460289 RepID=A0A0M0JSY6_9EUKA|nr:tenascin isoform 2 [Chrysochromulina tobinii]|eukprot:KOO29704.1 tenascin isoform 2 [Chrysochromulina sp. CCMP291]
MSFIQQLEFQEEQAEWSVFPSTGTPPSPRGGHCSHLVLQTLYIFGGCAAGTRSKCLNDMHALDLSSGAWSRVATSGSAPHPASNVACASNGPVLAVFGGYAGTYTSKVHLFDATTRVWTLAMPAGVAPKPRQGATLTRFAGGFVLFGGTDDATPFNDVHVLASDAKQWTDPKARCVPMPCALPAPREGHSAALIGTKLWVYGGVGKVGRSYVSLTDLAYFDVITSTWHDPAVQMQATDLAPSARSLHAALTLGSRLLILGGWITPQRTPLPDVAILDAETFSWSRPLPSGTPPPARYGQSLTLRGRTVFTFGAKSLGGAMAAAGPIIGSTSCPSSCSAHGKCWQGRCLCEPGYEGYDCSLLSECNCHERGVCAHGRCFCDPGFDGPQCELIARCANDCSAHGVCVHGRCTCAAGFTGADCSELVACPHGCSGRGICINAKCYCLYGSSGEGCEVTEPCPGSHEHTSCSGRGECFEGKCLCEPGFAGVACDEALPCPGDCRDADGVQRGRCVHGQCWCDPGFGGETCAEVASCVNDCSHRGVCFRGACACEAGYGGDDCSQALFECQANCTGHGACRLGTCFCEPSWQGVACEQPIECPHACSAHGLCLGGKCLCEEGYGGLDCAVPLPSCLNEYEGEDCSLVSACPEDCSSHGLCRHGQCFCDAGFEGHACELPTPCPGQCSQRGLCVHGSCFCDAGYGGPDCLDQVRCPVANGRTCSGRGLCALGTCVCVAGVGGVACSEVFTAAAAIAFQTGDAPSAAANVGVEGSNRAVEGSATGLVEYRTRPVQRAARAPGRALLFLGHSGAADDGADGAYPVEGISLGTATLVLVVLASVGAGLGWGVRHALELRQRRKMREILQAEAQRPFSSGLG